MCRRCKGIQLLAAGRWRKQLSSVLRSVLSLAGFLQVGLLDVDICGPSVPKLTGLENQEIHRSNLGWSPVYVEDNLAVMSIGFLLPNPDDAVIWRGPRKNGLIKQFLKVPSLQLLLILFRFSRDSVAEVLTALSLTGLWVPLKELTCLLAAGCALGRAGLPCHRHPARDLR